MYFFCSLYLTLCTFTFNYWLDILPYFLSVHQEKIEILISSGFTLTHIKVWQDRRTWEADKIEPFRWIGSLSVLLCVIVGSFETETDLGNGQKHIKY